MDEHEIQEFVVLIARCVNKEFKRMIGLRKFYNPFTLQFIRLSSTLINKSQDEFLYLIKYFIENAINTYNRYYVTRNESKTILEEIEFPRILQRLGIKDKRVDTVISKFLNDLRRLNIIKLFVKSREISYKLPIIFPSWREYLKVNNLRLSIIGIFNDRVISASEKRLKDAIFLSFFEGNPMTDIIKEIYIRYGSFNVDINTFLNLLNEKIERVLRDMPYIEKNFEISYNLFTVNSKRLKQTLKFIFNLKGIEVISNDNKVVIPSDVLRNIIEGLKMEHFTYEQYFEALKNAWKRYWKGLPPWYASLERMLPLINQELSQITRKSINLTLEEHLRYITELARWGKIEYWTGGIDPKHRHWIKLR